MSEVGYVPDKQFTEQEYDLMESYSKIALPQAIIATLLGYNFNTFKHKYRKDPEAKKRIKYGRAYAIQFAHDWAFKKAFVDDNEKIAILWLRTQAGWSEKTIHEISGPNGSPLEIGEKLNATDRMAEIVKQLVDSPKE